MSVADGTKGSRLYDWAAAQFGISVEGGLRRWVLFRRSIEKPDDLAYYLCLAPADATAADLGKAAGQRWSIECCFEAAKQETGLDEYEVRSWHRLVPAYHPVDVGAGIPVRSPLEGEWKLGTGKKSEKLVPLTEPEIRRLFVVIVWLRMSEGEKSRLWSHWRREHQAIARECHYKKRRCHNPLL